MKVEDKIKGPIEISTYSDLGFNRQEIRMTQSGGGPGGMEVIFECTDKEIGVAIKIWNPFKHEWTTVNPDALMNHGDTRT